MRRAPTIFGQPLWIGLKRRVGQRHARRVWGPWRSLLAEWGKTQAGDLYCDCSGLNRRLATAEPDYRRVGRKGKVLFDLDLTATDSSTCSFRFCGVEPPLTFEQAEQFRRQLVDKEQRRGDADGFARRYSPDVMNIHEDGTFSELRKPVASQTQTA
jgi:hypothetical protein